MMRSRHCDKREHKRLALLSQGRHCATGDAPVTLTCADRPSCAGGRSAPSPNAIIATPPNGAATVLLSSSVPGAAEEMPTSPAEPQYVSGPTCTVAPWLQFVICIHVCPVRELQKKVTMSYLC